MNSSTSIRSKEFYQNSNDTNNQSNTTIENSLRDVGLNLNSFGVGVWVLGVRGLGLRVWGFRVEVEGWGEIRHHGVSSGSVPLFLQLSATTKEFIP